MSEALLKVNGRNYAGWKSIEVNRSIDQACGAFSLEVTEKFPGRPDRWPIEPDHECRLDLDGHQAITGYVDSADRNMDVNQSGVSVVGRDKARDLVDCSAHRPGTLSDTGEFAAMRLDELISTLAKPYGVSVVVATGLDLGAPFKKPGIEPGETAWDCAERYARQRGILVMSDGLGHLLLTTAGRAFNPNALVEGLNIEAAQYVHDHSNRFHHYVALGQTESSDGWGAEKAAHPRADTKDPDGKEGRKLIFMAEDLADGVTLQDRVRFERDVRRARSMQLVVTVSGFSANGHLWNPNEMVPVKIPGWNINTNLLIQTVTATKDKGGTRTDLTLVPRSVYERLPEAPAGDHHEGNGGWK